MNTCIKYLPLMSVFAGIVGSAAAHAEEFNPDFKFNSLIQSWLYNDTNAAARPDFRIRRAQLRFSGNVTPAVRWFAMIDMAKIIANRADSELLAPDSKFLQDVGAGFTLMPGLELVVGQFKTLTTAEGLGRSAELPMPERTVVGRFYGDRRQQGAMMSYKYEKFQIGAMISNDPGANQADIDGKKDFTARVDYEVRDGMRVGAFTGAGNYSYVYNGRTGANVSAAFGNLIVAAEGAMGEMLNDGVQQKNSGIMGYAGYILRGKWQLVVRFSNLNPFTNASDYGLSETRPAQEYGVGLNYYIAKNNAKIQIGYTYLKNDTATLGTPSATASNILGASGLNHSVTQLSFQAAF